ncbi:NAD(P)-dependent dehydrogenase (short-subunit alcohol dehydrogenase family) [Arthrobacter pascens]|uniref:SDR family oxidoreductase n=1 Tax=Arthrobacter pascens TaxID=1677 RepID=UPI00285C7E2A|nr:SDR family NAD(P)-dependent oxidoreductase [Arthrobacter pascens]MDR6558602.1 NAD(P)-dependent dehydrogenase (short-subunit alcohol dehydrogenase family) [Arthrobacter pascens]
MASHLALLAAGFRIYGSGRSIEQADLPREIRRLRCDHLKDEETARVFDVIQSECGGLDLLVNCAWGGYEKMVEGGVFTWTAPFWDQPPHRWTGMMDGGVRAAFVCAAHAARVMTPRHRGLIINISFWAAQRHLANTIYGIAKAATDKMTTRNVSPRTSTFSILNAALSRFPPSTASTPAYAVARNRKP